MMKKRKKRKKERMLNGDALLMVCFIFIYIILVFLKKKKNKELFECCEIFISFRYCSDLLIPSDFGDTIIIMGEEFCCIVGVECVCVM